MDRNRRVDHQDVIAGTGLDQRREVCLQTELRVGNERWNSRNGSSHGQEGMPISRLMEDLRRSRQKFSSIHGVPLRLLAARSRRPQSGETACVKARTKGYPNSSLPDNI